MKEENNNLIDGWREGGMDGEGVGKHSFVSSGCWGPCWNDGDTHRPGCTGFHREPIFLYTLQNSVWHLFNLKTFTHTKVSATVTDTWLLNPLFSAENKRKTRERWGSATWLHGCWTFFYRYRVRQRGPVAVAEPPFFPPRSEGSGSATWFHGCWTFFNRYFAVSGSATGVE